MVLALKKSGFSVSCFTDPVTALDEFRSHSADYELILSDIRMPHINGYKFKDKLEMIHNALIFTLNCLDGEQIRVYNSMKLVLAKTEGLLKKI